MRRRLGAAVMISFALAAAGVHAAPPSVTALNPAGLARGSTAELALIGKLGDRPVRAWCSRDDVELALADDKELLRVTAPADAPAGRCWIRLYNDEGATDLLPLQIGLLPERAETEPNNHARDAQRIESLPATVNGVLHKSGEVDTFAVTLRKGETLVASLAAYEGIGSPMDGVMQLVSAEGYVLEHNDDHHGSDPQLEYTAETDRELLVRLFAFPHEPNSTINFAGNGDYIYRLTLTTGPFVDHIVPTDSGARAVGWNLPEDADPDDAPGLHHLSPHSPADQEGRPVVAAGAAGALTRGEIVVGEISAPGEVDAFPFKAAKGETLRFTVEAQRLWSALDPVLTIRDSEGKELESSDDISRQDQDIAFTWKAPADGEFRAEVSDRFGHGGMRCVYRLMIDLNRPRFEVELEAGRFVLKRDKPLEIEVKIRRLDGFKEELTVEAVDLPDGVKAAPAVSAGEGDTSKSVKLKLTANSDAACHGPFRIVARTGEESARPQTATADTRMPELRSPLLWLTCGPGKSE